MVKKGKNNSSKRAARSHVKANARSLRFSQNIKSGRAFADLMSALMNDLLTEKVSPQVGTVVCNAGGKLLKIVEMQFKYGRPSIKGTKDISLSLDVKSSEAPRLPR